MRASFFRGSVLCSGFAFVVWAGCQSAGPPAPATPSTVPAASAEPQSTSVPSSSELQQPPDGEWLTDEDGREYYIWEVARVEGHYIWVDEKTVRLRHGLELMLDHHDETTFYVKRFRVRPEDEAPPSRAKPTAEQLAAAATRYAVQVEPVARPDWAPFDRGLPARGQWRHGFAFGDMNGDGQLDLVHGPQRKGGGGLHVFLGDGAGNWRPWPVRTPRGLQLDYGDVAVADFNRDGRADVVMAMHLLGLVVLTGDGQGNFEPWSDGVDYAPTGAGGATAAAGFSSRAVETGDWNGDGRPDVVALGEGMRLNIGGEGAPVGGSSSFGVVVYLNQGDGRWLRFDRGTLSDQISGQDIALGDFDRSGRLDILTASSVRRRTDLVRLTELPPAVDWRTTKVEGLPPSLLVYGVAVADFDRDGTDDFVAAWQNAELGVSRAGADAYLSRPTAAGEPSWQRVRIAAAENAPPFWTAAAGDVDGDGAIDAVFGDTSGALAVFLGDGRGGFRRGQSPPVDPSLVGCHVYGSEVRDVDGDGTGEVFVSFAGEAPNALAIVIDPQTPKCPSGGALRAWTTARKPAAGS